uniref:Uncharacterized protein n=1 Tax=Rhizophora mucronata TaxID=61149 RepID=A0A2P2MNX7_RHIMU
MNQSSRNWTYRNNSGQDQTTQI